MFYVARYLNYYRFNLLQHSKSPLRKTTRVVILSYMMLLEELGMFQLIKQRLKEYVIAFSKHKTKP